MGRGTSVASLFISTCPENVEAGPDALVGGSQPPFLDLTRGRSLPLLGGEVDVQNFCVSFKCQIRLCGAVVNWV